MILASATLQAKDKINGFTDQRVYWVVRLLVRPQLNMRGFRSAKGSDKIHITLTARR